MTISNTELIVSGMPDTVVKLTCDDGALGVCRLVSTPPRVTTPPPWRKHRPNIFVLVTPAACSC